MLSRLIPRLAVVLALIALVGGCGGPSTPEGIVLITIDSCRPDRIGCYGSDTCETPAIDALAESGALFLDAAAPVPVTLPSHCSILTGLYPDRHTVRDNASHRLPDEALTLAEVLADAGWKTGAFIGAARLERRFGTMQGFQDYDDMLPEGGSPAETGPDRDDGDLGVFTRLLTPQRPADQVVDSALTWIEAARSEQRPFLLWVHLSDPHAPYAAPARFDERYGEGSYEGEVAFVDEQIGRLMDGLGSARGRVLVAVTADHGEALGDHGERTHGFFVYRATTAVPWIVTGPGIPRGTRVKRPVSLVQVMPTLLEAVGVAFPTGLDGRSTLPLIAGTAGVETDPVYGESLVPSLGSRWPGLRSVRRGRWKYIDAPTPELYDLKADPQEETNVADANPVVVTDLSNELERHASRGGALPAREIAPTAEQLNTIGSLGGNGPGSIPLADLRAAVKRLPDDPFVLGILSAAATSLEPAGAYALAKDAAEVSPRNPVILDALGWAATRSGHAADAVAPLTDAWERTNDAGVRAHLGLALVESGNVPAGRAHLLAAVQDHPALRSLPGVADWLNSDGAGGPDDGGRR